MAPVRIPDALKALLVPLEALSQFPGNPNNGDLDAITESIRVNGFNTPILVQRSTMRIIAGNHRYQAMLGLGQTHIPAVPIDITDEQAKRYLLADNRTARLGMDDEALLVEMLNELAETDIGLLGTGYTEDAYTDLLNSLAQIELPEVDGEGFGSAGMGIFQVVVDFESAEDRDALLSELRMRYDDDMVRKLDL